MSFDKRVAVNVVSGTLGAGKTTAINHLLRHRPPHESWAVLVNEYGLVGLDAALLGETPSKDVEIKEVAGGCICCTAGVMFQVSLVMLLKRRPDRLLIEPTGLATLSGIMDTLGCAGIRDAVDLRSVFALIDPSTLEQHRHRQEFIDQVEAADVLLASRSDLAAPEQLEAFDAWARAIFPPKRSVGRIEGGQIPLEMLDLVADRSAPEGRSNPDHGAHGDAHTHGHEDTRCDETRRIVRLSHRSTAASTIGWMCWNGLQFSAERLTRWLRELSTTAGTRRAKAVMRTDRGWRAFNFAEGTEELRATGYRRDSRLELVIDGDRLPDPDDLERALRDCLADDSV